MEFDKLVHALDFVEGQFTLLLDFSLMKCSSRLFHFSAYFGFDSP